MKKMLALTIIFIAVPSFFILTDSKEEINYQIKEEKKENNNNDITIKVKQTNKNKIKR